MALSDQQHLPRLQQSGSSKLHPVDPRRNAPPSVIETPPHNCMAPRFRPAARQETTNQPTPNIIDAEINDAFGR
jgi:hypothetical protein